MLGHVRSTFCSRWLFASIHIWFVIELFQLNACVGSSLVCSEEDEPKSEKFGKHVTWNSVFVGTTVVTRTLSLETRDISVSRRL